MNKSLFKIFVLFICSCSLTSFRARATHIVGGDISSLWISGNDFQITLNFFRDCSSGSANFDDTIELGIYDRVTNIMQQSFKMRLLTRDTLQLGDTCFIPQNLCVEKGLYIATVTIPDNPNGYYIAWQRCCRNFIIQNIVAPGNAGMVFYIEIPDPALHDDSPVFGSYPNAYMCLNQPNIFSFGCNDIDGDSLVYSLVTPMNGNTDPSNSGQYPAYPVLASGPYTDIIWQTPYSASDMVGGVPPMTINPNTGIITAQPSQPGIFVFAVRVEEYRNGIKIGEVRRDIQYQVVNCPLSFPPFFSSPVTTTTLQPSASASYILIAGDTLSFDVTVTSGMQSDSIYLYDTSANSFSSLPGMDITFSNDSDVGSVNQKFYLQTECSAIRDEPYHMKFSGLKHSCYGLMKTTLDVDIFVKPPVDGAIDTLVPNVFTPNGDGKNDFFHIKATPNYCFDTFNMKIFNRWGELMYESNDFLFQWDGKNKSGNKLPEGVYYYILNATFKQSSFSKRGVIHLRL